jgi:hypothetical protein
MKVPSPEVAQQKANSESAEGATEGKSFAPQPFSLTAGPIQTKSVASAPIQRKADPLIEAVRLIKATKPNTGSTMLTENLVRGIIEAEGMFLKYSPLNRLSESLGQSGTVGPGQLGAPAIVDVDRTYASASTQFAKSQGAAPADWKEKANDANWKYFYIAGYLAICIQNAEDNFNPAETRTLSNLQIGLLDIGIARYHGAHEMIKALRRRVAEENGNIKPQQVTADMVSKEMRSGTEKAQERELEQYTQLAKGGFDFDFNIKAATTSRRFQIYGGKVKIQCNGNYELKEALDPKRGNKYRIRLEKFEMVSGFGGMAAEGTNWYNWINYDVGHSQYGEWTDLPQGEYRFKAEKIEDSYSADVLVGKGKVETMY